MDILYTILYYGYLALYFYYFVIIVWIILGWTPIVRTRFYDFLGTVVSPYMHFFRGWFMLGHLDFTPMIGIFLYQGILAFIGNVL